MVSIHQGPYGVNRTCLRIGLLGRRFAEGSLDSSLSNTIVRLALVMPTTSASTAGFLIPLKLPESSVSAAL